jgi:cell division protease FtsH
VLLAGTLTEEMIYTDISTGAQNDLERATEIARSMVMDYGMSRLGRVNYRESNQSPFLAAAGGESYSRSHSEQTAREIDEEVRRIIDGSIETVKHMLEVRKKALVAITERLIEVESIDADDLQQIIDENSPGPVVVPGTADAPTRQKSEPQTVSDSKQSEKSG